MKLQTTLWLLAIAWSTTAKTADIVVENDVIKPEEIYDFISLDDSDVWWETPNATKYYCMMRSMWNATRHPKEFPYPARMANPLVYSARVEYRPWLLNRQTTWGVEKMAETGFNDIFRDDINRAGYVHGLCAGVGCCMPLLRLHCQHYFFFYLVSDEIFWTQWKEKDSLWTK